MSDPVGLGIIGLGRWAEAHARAAARSDAVRFVSCHSRTPEHRSAFRDRHDLPSAAASIAALVDDDRVEAVVVATPNDRHVEHAAAVLDAGKPVLVDKPVAVDVASGLRLWRRTRREPVPVGVAHHARRLAGHRAARDWLDGRDSGRAVMAHADFSNARGAALRPDAWHRHVRGAEAGVLMQVGIHHVDTLASLLGPATAVSARFGYGPLGPDVPVTAVVMLRHVDGAVSTVTSSWLTPSHYRMDVLATGGNLTYRLDHGRWTSPDVDDAGDVVLDAGGERRAHPWTGGDPLVAQLDELGAAARQGTPMAVTVVDGLRAVAVVQAAVASARSAGAEVTIADVARAAGADDDEVRELTGTSRSAAAGHGTRGDR